jgi:hypothetical protein
METPIAPFDGAAHRATSDGETNDSAALNGASAASEADIAELKAHPRFAEACRQAALDGIKLYRGNRLFNTLLNDRGRSAVSVLSLYLHRQWRPDDPRSGLTVSRLKSLCADQNIGSPGRIEAVVMLMRVFGMLKPAPSAADRRVRRLEPTERLVAMLHERWFGVLAAMALVMPEARSIRAALADDAFEGALIRHFGAHFLTGARMIDNPDARSLIGDRNAGLMIVFSLATAGGPDDFPPRQPVTISISALARHFGVSRGHVRKWLTDAADGGYIARSSAEDSAITVLPPLHAVVENFFANAFLFMRDCARRAFDEIEQEPDATVGRRT